MPHAVEQDDDDLINQLISGGNVPGLESQNILDRDLDVGEKADDALDFEDISDDDLAEEEDETPAHSALPQTNGHSHVEQEGGDDSGLFDEDDLFGTLDQPQSPNGLEESPQSRPARQSIEFSQNAQEYHSFESLTAEPVSAHSPADVNQNLRESEDADLDDEDDPDVREQRLLFATSRQHYEELLRSGDRSSEPPPPPQSNAELFSIIWPQFEANQPPRFGQLLPGKRAYYLSKAPIKPPKPVHPTKVNLELHPDQEKSFKLPETNHHTLVTRLAEAEACGLVLVTNENPNDDQAENDIALETLDEDQEVGGVKWEDLMVLCEDWEVPSSDEISIDDQEATMDDDLFGILVPPSTNKENQITIGKKRKSAETCLDIASLIQEDDTLFENPEEATRRLSKRVKLDLNDPYMLVDLQQQADAARQKRKGPRIFKRDATGGLTRDLNRRYNISNDDAYDMLKKNHQSKVRSHLGNIAIEHSLPAIKLQYPFYKVKLIPKEARSFHRPALSLNPSLVHFSKANFIKKKHLRGRETTDIFATAKDLSIGDNSSLLLLEYCEEYPAMLSSFGMGNRLVNYYRRKDEQDGSRPKHEIGETAVLLPQDKSPFSIFGDVDPGHTTPTIHNAMYRAPIFKHDADQRDFIVVRNRTGIDGATWHMRNVENLHVVGQEFPSVEVPGTHSRKVTDAAKKRLRMLSFRLFKKYNKLTNEMIRKHLPGSDIAQNRSKMREIMDYHKEKGWLPKKGDILSDESSIRSWIKPEDIALLESMQVGDRHLQDAGYNKDEDELDQDEEEEKDGQSLDHQLAPWHTTKNFLNACQGKAMLELHGEGDPSGRNEAFSMIRTSMKGGFKQIGESVEDRLDAKRLKENGGHSYNVAKQHKLYTDAIRRIWEAQRNSLSSSVKHDVDEEGVDSNNARDQSRAETPLGPLGRARKDDDLGSVMSRTSEASQSGKVLKITRHITDKYGKPERQEEIIRDPKIIREYVKRRRQQELSNLSYSDMRLTGDPEQDRLQQKAIEAEIARLERNKERRHAREKAKGIVSAASPDAGASPSVEGSDMPTKKNTGGTQRKCANCGQVGHIKTNKKYYKCPTCVFMSTPIKHLH